MHHASHQKALDLPLSVTLGAGEMLLSANLNLVGLTVIHSSDKGTCLAGSG